MILMIQVQREFASPEVKIGLLALVALAAYGIWAMFRRLPGDAIAPEPWDAQVALELEKEETLPLCHRCLTPHLVSLDFCPECGAAVGKYTNLLPFPYLFSLGHTLRIGTSGDFRRSPLTIAGFLLLGFYKFSLFAPVYWFIFLRHLSRQPPAPPSETGDAVKP